MTGSRVIAVGGTPMFRQQVARALDLDSEAIDWTATVSAAESSLAERTEPANVVVVSPAVKEVDAFGLAEFVSKSSPASAVLLVRDHTANGILPAAMRAGIREVVDLSRGGEDLQEALERATNWSQSLLAVQGTGPVTAQEYGKVFSVFSSKGGTGKTFLATGLAQSLARDTQKDVALLDLELTMSDSLSYFGKEPSRALQDLLSIGEESDRAQILEHGVQVDEHLWVYASPPDPAGLEAVSSESLGKVISSLRQNFAYVLIDGTATYSDAVLAAFDLSETVALIAGLDVVGVRHLSLALQTFISLGFPTDRFRFVLNRADSKVGLSVETVERIMKLKVDGMIPSSRLVPTALNQGRTVVEQYPNADVTKAIGTLARKLAAVYETGPAKRRLFRKA